MQRCVLVQIENVKTPPWSNNIQLSVGNHFGFIGARLARMREKIGSRRNAAQKQFKHDYGKGTQEIPVFERTKVVFGDKAPLAVGM